MKKKIISLLMVSLLLVVYLPTNALAADSSKTQTYVNTQKLAAEKAAFLTEKIERQVSNMLLSMAIISL